MENFLRKFVGGVARLWNVLFNPELYSQVTEGRSHYVLQSSDSPLPSPPSAEGVTFVPRTLPVHAKDVGDGDGITVYVDTADQPAEVPTQVKEAAIQRKRARAAKNFKKADSLKEMIRAEGYGFRKNADGDEILEKIYRIRLKGVDAPESKMVGGKEAKDELIKLVNRGCLKINVYYLDKHGRCIGDVYCNGFFVQEQMLKSGWVWHYRAYDKRTEFARWHKQARAASKGLWNLSENPEKPWKWRRRNPGWRGQYNFYADV